MPSFSNSPRIRSAPHSRFFPAISLIKATVSAAIFGVCEVALDRRFQTRRKSSRCERQQCICLDNKKGLPSCVNHPGQQDEKYSIRLATVWSFHLSTENDELLAYRY